MTVTVTPTPDGAGAAGTATPDSVAPMSPLFSLREARQSVQQSLHLDLRVPRYKEPQVWVRYRPIDSVRLEEQLRKRAESTDRESNLNANADILVNSCEGIFAKLPDHPDQKFSVRLGDPHGSLTGFDDDLAVSMGLTEVEKTSAVAICRALYATDGDLVTAAAQVLDWSAEESEKADADFTNRS